MRWALFPALAALAGGVGGAIFNARFAAMAGAMGGGAALASMLTVRLWPSLVAAPAFGILAASSGMALFQAVESGGIPNAWRMLDRLLGEPEALILLSAVPLLQSLIHRIALPRPWPLGLAAGFGAAAIAFVLAAAFVRSSGTQVGGFLAAATIAQVPAVLAARAVAHRLRRGESPSC